MTLLKKSVAACAVALAGLAVTSSHAALTFGSIPGGLPNSNQFLNVYTGGVAVEGWYGASIFLTGQSDLKIEYFGAEAGYDNEFSFGGTTIAHSGGGNTTQATPIAGETFTLSNVAAGSLQFSFLIDGAGLPLHNAANPDNGTPGVPNFFVSFDNNGALDVDGSGTASTGGQSVFLFLDDGAGGNPSDDNHDDMVLRISITRGGTFQVPEPTSLALLGAALLGLGAARRRSATKQ